MSDAQRGATMDPELLKKRRDFEAQKARTKLALNICTICGKKDARPCKGCGTTAYCGTDCQRIDWRDRGHRKACKKIQAERTAEAARADAPTPPPSPPKVVFYGPAPRSHADEVRARIAAEHEAARTRREANPEPEPLSARYGSRCPICMEDWDVNLAPSLLVCCCRKICNTCAKKIILEELDKDEDVILCPLCRVPFPITHAEQLAHLRRHVENEVPEAIQNLGDAYLHGQLGLTVNARKAAKIWKRAVELGSVDAMVSLGLMYNYGTGVKLNLNKAAQLFRMGADRGLAKGEFNLANVLREQGKFEEAFHYTKLAAEQGHRDAQYNLAVMYEDGHGGDIETDLDEAGRWYARAAAGGDEDAAARLEQLNK